MNLFIKIFCYSKNTVYLCSIERTFFETRLLFFTIRFCRIFIPHSYKKYTLIDLHLWERNCKIKVK